MKGRQVGVGGGVCEELRSVAWLAVRLSDALAGSPLITAMTPGQVRRKIHEEIVEGDSSRS